MSVPNHLDTVVAERAKYPAPQYDAEGRLLNPLGPAAAWAITNAVAYKHSAEGFGLRRKPDGQNYNGYSIDVIIHKPTGTWLDILGSSEAEGRPQWGTTTPAGPTDDYWMPPVSAPGGPTDPTVDPPMTDIEARVLALEEDLMRLREAMTGWIIG